MDRRYIRRRLSAQGHYSVPANDDGASSCDAAGPSSSWAPENPLLLQLPAEVLHEHILPRLDALSLVALDQTARWFRSRDEIARLTVTEAAARTALLRLVGEERAQRWRARSWKERLYLEQCTTGFDRNLCEAQGFQVEQTRLDPVTGRRLPPRVSLVGMGPRLLVSDASTKQAPMLRWRLRVRGNTAVEFGVVPLQLQNDALALHKCKAVEERESAMGFASQITAGTNLPLRAAIMRNSSVEVVARRGRVEFLITNAPDAKEVQWRNGQPVQRPYRGPQVVRFQQEFPPTCDVKLAVTCWAKSSFDVLHPADVSAWARPAGEEEDGDGDELDGCATPGRDGLLPPATPGAAGPSAAAGHFMLGAALAHAGMPPPSPLSAANNALAPMSPAPTPPMSPAPTWLGAAGLPPAPHPPVAATLAAAAQHFSFARRPASAAASRPASATPGASRPASATPGPSRPASASGASSSNSARGWYR